MRKKKEQKQIKVILEDDTTVSLMIDADLSEAQILKLLHKEYGKQGWLGYEILEEITYEEDVQTNFSIN